MKTSKKRGARNKRKTMKGGDIPNQKAYIVVSKSKIEPVKKKFLHTILLARPTLNILDYFSYNMDLVDEGLAAIKYKDPEQDIYGKKLVEEDTVYIEEIQIGHNKTDKIKKSEAKRAKRAKRERERERYDGDEDEE
jgi:hypothetical protein